MKKTDNHNSYNEKKIAKEISSLRSIRLSEKESKELWTLITSQIPTVSPFSRQSFTLRSLLSFGSRLVAMVLVLILGLGSGLTYASEESLPGDFLYPFKVHVSEEIQSLSKTDSESRASFATERAERRLSEVKILVTQGSFDEVKSKEAVENFEKHTKKAKEETQKLSKTNPDKALVVASNFETSLQTNSIILEELKKDTGSTKILEDVVAQVQTETVSVSEEKDKIITRVFSDNTVTEEVRNNIIEEKIKQVESQLNSDIDTEIELDATVPTVENIKDSESGITINQDSNSQNFFGKEQLEKSRLLAKEGKLDEAFILLHKTHSDLEKNRVLAVLDKERVTAKIASEKKSSIQDSKVAVSDNVLKSDMIKLSVAGSVYENNDTSLSPNALWKIIKKEKNQDDGSYEASYYVVSTSESNQSAHFLFSNKNSIKDSYLPAYVWSPDSKYLAYEQNIVEKNTTFITILQLSNNEKKASFEGHIIATIEPLKASFNTSNTNEFSYFVKKDDIVVLEKYTLPVPELPKPAIVEDVKKNEEPVFFKQKTTQ